MLRSPPGKGSPHRGTSPRWDRNGGRAVGKAVLQRGKLGGKDETGSGRVPERRRGPDRHPSSSLIQRGREGCGKAMERRLLRDHIVSFEVSRKGRMEVSPLKRRQRQGENLKEGKRWSVSLERGAEKP
ncbi:hypothetical protein NCLIV_044940 [Neospora caninum Liverpool]|uniref:Uncharacterized protein n=1 Tax=Neospora caninum (strain Liverpool) TaxID=572307 RepID=F0VK15_NEOCL|nr:hypothetical protein NCLIV_044940 [Neospora caninum Liverpool]CBZ54060.1 hypothetical protein NCLIV_044940 [Neospora caninum Liverpool]CEL68756.1 TPA: hypothetical protein BN1204_044940 [Neospora caninum Liverpool]|eukprot:XP_003884091.1 hypothetical protein NCLIV_044940 [Neospora caninum Liverpool]